MDVKFSLKEMQRLRSSDWIAGVVLDHAERIAQECGDGYVARASSRTARARAVVITATGHAIRSNAKHNTMVRVLGGGG